jgi:hypothetical protein
VGERKKRGKIQEATQGRKREKEEGGHWQISREKRNLGTLAVGLKRERAQCDQRGRCDATERAAVKCGRAFFGPSTFLP